MINLTYYHDPIDTFSRSTNIGVEFYQWTDLSLDLLHSTLLLVLPGGPAQLGAAAHPGPAAALHAGPHRRSLGCRQAGQGEPRIRQGKHE